MFQQAFFRTKSQSRMGHLKVLVLLIACFQCAISGEKSKLTKTNAFSEFVAQSIGKSGCSLDVMFVLDGSGSIGTQDFLLVKQWVKALAKRLAELYADIQLGVMQYSHYSPYLPLAQQRFIKTEVELDYYTYTDFALAVDMISYMGYTTFTAAALRRVRSDFLNSTNFGKPGNNRIMILITDGRANDFIDLSQSALDLRSIGVIPLVFGVGRAKLNELRIIATGNQNSSERVQVFGDFSSLQSAIVDMKQYLDICEGASTTQSTRAIPFTEELQTTPEHIDSVAAMTTPRSFTTKTSRTIAARTTPTTPTHQSTLPGCSLDVMFVLDGSGSIGTQDFLLVKQWVKTLAKRIAELHADIQLGVMQYSHYFQSLPLAQQSYIKTEVELDYYNYTDFALAVDKISYTGYTTYTAAALRRVKSDFLNSTNFGKPGNIQMMILMTDGEANDFIDLPQSAVDLRRIGVIPLVIGVGRVNLNELRIIATGNQNSSERVKVFGDFSSLQSAIVDLKQYLDICEGAGTTQGTQAIPFTVGRETTPEHIDSGCLADVIFVLDGSSSVLVQNFVIIKHWVIASTRRMTAIHRSSIQFGVMQYSSYSSFRPFSAQASIKMEIPLDYHNHSDFAAAVGEITYMTGSTYTAAALRIVKPEFLNSANFNRSGNSQIMILVTDGRSADFNNLAQSAMELRSIGVIPLVYGVGAADAKELRIIATGNPSSTERVTMIPDFGDLMSVQSDLKKYLRNC